MKMEHVVGHRLWPQLGQQSQEGPLGSADPPGPGGGGLRGLCCPAALYLKGPVSPACAFCSTCLRELDPILTEVTLMNTRSELCTLPQEKDQLRF